ncbi:rab-3A-interacting protein isoform X1 [Zootoca vivipara]|uniref:rab-3A-interacting protein isoform X1 n=1 Tax=Zootoca vivipara TaxID=8524 RepID=UPI00293BDCAA|nr:rab-3A-interacting protein isoform X1 [Zootoca vivipara]XP_060135638.1 rab-3A-interacting protein isoform X1 [Zootoca vivipara]XP_060135641.1 rab-3A-interacting protein isoform X1 [Zootoca vivipara]
MANDTLEGFHEVNLASPTTPDLLGVYESSASEQTTSPTVIYRLHASAVCSTPIQPSALNVSDLPTQPVYSSPRHLNCAEASGISINVTETIPCSTSGLQGAPSKYDNSRKASGNAEREFLQGATITDSAEGSDDVLGLSTDSLSRLRSPSVLEVREKGYERLKEELAKAQRELKLKDEECERLSKVRDQLGQELEELTASLFEEAHKMVREANIKQATAEKQLKEAQGKIDVLQAEVAALKTLVLSTSPTSPTKELQSSGKTPFKKGHARNKSTSSAMGVSNQDVAMMQPIVKDCKEADLALYNEFRSWKDDPTMDRGCPFLDKIYQEDIFPCLTFSKSEVTFWNHIQELASSGGGDGYQFGWLSKFVEEKASNHDGYYFLPLWSEQNASECQLLETTGSCFAGFSQASGCLLSRDSGFSYPEKVFYMHYNTVTPDGGVMSRLSSTGFPVTKFTTRFPKTRF